MAADVDPVRDRLQLSRELHRRGEVFNGVDFLGVYVERVPVIVVPELPEVVEELDELPEVKGPREHVPVPAAVVVVQVNVEQASGLREEGGGLGGALLGIEGVADVEGGAEVGGTGEKTERRRFPRGPQEAARDGSFFLYSMQMRMSRSCAQTAANVSNAYSYTFR